ncbi:MAG: hypothetical protein Q7T92_09025 [Lutibacter sp.]|nr:hypothetical protein [Lutibacter sp.]
MKQINFIGSENVVNIASPKKINIIGENTCENNGAVLPASTDKKNRFKLKNREAANHSNVFSKYFEAMPK